uniref:Uncharacterized protein n=1 Tax=viral metagenome TaxID=1070528 RepID=A0A6C0DMC7_9ZZZZ
MLNTIFQKKNFSTILIIILLALFLVVAFMRYVKVNEGLSVGTDDITADSTKKPNEEKQIIQVIDVLG